MRGGLLPHDLSFKQNRFYLISVHCYKLRVQYKGNEQHYKYSHDISVNTILWYAHLDIIIGMTKKKIFHTQKTPE